MASRVPPPTHLDDLVRRGIVHFDTREWGPALACFDEVLEHAPTHAQALNYQARTFEGLGRLEDAVRSIDRAIASDPKNAADHRNRGLALRKLGRLEEAVRSFDAALALNPRFTDVLLKRAAALDALERREDALASAERAVALEPRNVDALNVRGMILDHLLRYDEALADFERMAAIQPDHVDAINNTGMIFARRAQFADALALYDRSLTLEPDVPHTMYNRSMVRLALGDWTRGFEEYEIRWKVAPLEAVRFTGLTRRWTGRESLEGKTILIHHEQGYGDTLQCARYVQLLIDRGAHVAIAVPNGLRALMDTVTGHPQVVSDGDAIPAHDYYCPMLSLPLAFGTTPDSVPGEVPYLSADATRVDRWANELGRRSRPRLGLVWSGRQFAPINYPRDVPLGVLRPLLSLDAEFITLQPDMSVADRSVLASMPHVRHFGKRLEDFADTAALIENLDLVIAADTAVAHLAGALAKPVWLMNRFAACWRWLQHRDDSPWYPTLRQFRQSTLGDWQGVADRLHAAAVDFLRDPPAIQGTSPAAAHAADRRRAQRPPRKPSSRPRRPATTTPPVAESRVPATVEKIRFVCATHHSSDDFFRKAPLGLSLPFYKDYPRGQPIELRLFPNSTDGIPAAYNVAIAEARADPAILVFIHDDIYLSDFHWAQRLLAGLRDFQIVGLAGNRRRTLGQASWEHSDHKCTRDSPDNLSGAIGYGNGFPALTEFVPFGDPGHEVKLLDGVLLAVRSATLVDNGLKFDERFPFDFYDLDFCRQAELRRVKMGTWPISAIRANGAPPRDARWQAAYHDYLGKYGELTAPPDRPQQDNPGNGDATANTLDDALSWHRDGKVGNAITVYRDVLRTQPSQPDALHYLGIGLAQLRQFDEAVRVLHRAIELRPKDSTVRVHYGNALLGVGRSADALLSYDQALVLDPSSVDAHYNRGAILSESGRPDLALESYDKALALAPSRADAHNNRGSVLAALGRHREARDSYDRALALDPLFPSARCNKSLVALLHGDFDHGWPLHAACAALQRPSRRRRLIDRPEWTGIDDVRGKTLLLYAEQGHGDTIQYCRYAMLLRQRGAQVLFEVPADLKALMQSLPDVSATFAAGEPLPPVDLQCSFSDLPAAFRTDLKSVPRGVPYLHLDPSRITRWSERLGPPKRMRVGLAWSGNPTHRNDANRSVPLATLTPLRDCGVDFVSLQKQVRTTDEAAAAAFDIRQFGADLVDFADTAALIAQVDVVVSVDTAVAHLAGALGKPVWILLPLVPDWRWLLERNDSPWYPTARLFRQTTRGVWDDVVESVGRELVALAADLKTRPSDHAG